jgi:hypothetical protein
MGFVDVDDFLNYFYLKKILKKYFFNFLKIFFILTYQNIKKLNKKNKF